MAAIRRCLYLGKPIGAGAVPLLSTAVGVTLVFCILAFAAAVRMTRRCVA
jgi:hypothetical protein